MEWEGGLTAEDDADADVEAGTGSGGEGDGGGVDQRHGGVDHDGMGRGWGGADQGWRGDEDGSLMDEHRRRVMEPGPEVAVAVVVDDHGLVDDHGRWGEDHRLGGWREHHGGWGIGRGVVCGGDGGAGDGAHGQTSDAPPHGILGTGLGGGQGGEYYRQGSESEGRLHRGRWELRSRVETRANMKYSLAVMQDRQPRVGS